MMPDKDDVATTPPAPAAPAPMPSRRKFSKKRTLSKKAKAKDAAPAPVKADPITKANPLQKNGEPLVRRLRHTFGAVLLAVTLLLGGCSWAKSAGCSYDPITKTFECHVDGHTDADHEALKKDASE